MFVPQELPTVRKSVADAMEKLGKAIQSVKADPDDPELQAYLETASLRQSLGTAWLAESVPDAHAALVSSPESKSTVSAVPAATQPSSPKEAQTDSQTEPAASPNLDAESQAGGSSAGNLRRLSSSSKKSSGEQITSLLHTAAASSKESMVVQNLAHLLSYLEMTEIQEKILLVETMKDLDEKLEVWTKCVQQVKLLAGGISKSASNLTTHVANIARKAQRDETKKRRLEETKAVAEAKKKAKAAAKKVKDDANSTPPIFEIGLDKLQHTDVMPAMRDRGGCQNCLGAEVTGDFKEFGSIEAPVLFKGNGKISDWCNTPKMQVALGSFGGRYKKTESFTSYGKAQMVLFSKEGKEESVELLQHFMGTIPESSRVKGENDFARITDTLWLYGYDPELCSIAATPNGMAMLKVLAYGEVKWLVMECGSLLAALRTELKLETIGLDDLDRYIGALTHEDLVNCKKHGLKAVSCVQKANEAIFVPAGWICCEQCTQGMLIYGLRCTLLLRGEAAQASYETLVGLHSAAGKPTEKMQQALDLMLPIA
eukprot:s3755_g6.t1